MNATNLSIPRGKVKSYPIRKFNGGARPAISVEEDAIRGGRVVGFPR